MSDLTTIDTSTELLRAIATADVLDSRTARRHLFVAGHGCRERGRHHGPEQDGAEMIAQVWRECRWNKAKAARRLGLSRTQLYIRMRRYGIGEPST